MGKFHLYRELIDCHMESARVKRNVIDLRAQLMAVKVENATVQKRNRELCGNLAVQFDEILTKSQLDGQGAYLIGKHKRVT